MPDSLLNIFAEEARFMRDLSHLGEAVPPKDTLAAGTGHKASLSLPGIIVRGPQDPADVTVRVTGHKYDSDSGLLLLTVNIEETSAHHGLLTAHRPKELEVYLYDPGGSPQRLLNTDPIPLRGLTHQLLAIQLPDDLREKTLWRTFAGSSLGESLLPIRFVLR